ncbi:G-protein beta WD-40 repeats containing protein [Reticulomyxa filosa]|uniref:G-protein beta WD-40 repeats containing protein n=1 Tax=Reticulomyxa filosa TaxID=46433 RepID=X6LHX6_RETFI|nr:G-protein beta WD-40 repeats containing protein [Reticulomyxa filosa]|eukprot:ETO01224.1 G-protein beta WD-40 repeats containing protein [Reticulomyxa filosa]
MLYHSLLEFQTFAEHTNCVNSIEFSPFSGDQYLCSVSDDEIIRLCDIETSNPLNIFNEHNNVVCCVTFSPLQANNNNNDNSDETIRIWDIEKAKRLIVFKEHDDWVACVKYGSNELLNTILSGSHDKSVRLWDIRSGQQVQVFNGHKDYVKAVEYSPFVIKNSIDNSNVICSGSFDNTILFWDIRSHKKELHVIKEDDVILCFKFLKLNRQKEDANNTKNDYSFNLCCSFKKNQSYLGIIYIFKKNHFSNLFSI